MIARSAALAMRAARPIGAAAGLAALVLALVTVAYRTEVTALATIPADVAVFTLAGFAAALAAVALKSDSTGESAVAVPPPDEGPAADPPLVSTEVDAMLERPALVDIRPLDDQIARRRLRARVRRTAITVLADRHDLSRETAATLVQSGDWTDDPRAASFLATDVPLPIDLRLVDWAHGVRFRRGFEAAVAEIERIDAGAQVDAGGVPP